MEKNGFRVLKCSITPFQKDPGSLSRIDGSGEKAAQGLKMESYSLFDWSFISSLSDEGPGLSSSLRSFFMEMLYSSPHGPLHPRQINARERAWMSFYKLSTIHASQPITMTKITPFSRQGEYRTVAMASTGHAVFFSSLICHPTAVSSSRQHPHSPPPP